MTTGVISWSQTAGTNATADSAVNFAEGQAPSSLNDSNRALMASVAKYRDDISGALVTTGTSTAYTLLTNQGSHAAPADGTMLAFMPHVTNGASPTISIDGGTARSIVTEGANGTTVLPATLIAFTPYRIRYLAAGTIWILEGFYGNPYNVPLGGGMIFLGGTAPNSSFAMPYGQAISRSTYATLFAITSTVYGTGDGSTTFNLPDLRGRLPYGKDDMGGSAASRLTSTYFGASGATLGAVGGSQSHTLITAELPIITPAGTISSSLSSASASTPIRNWVTGGGGSTDTTHVSTGSNTGSDAGTFNSTVTGTVTSTFAGTAFGSGAAHAILPPGLVLNYVFRII